MSYEHHPYAQQHLQRRRKTPSGAPVAIAILVTLVLLVGIGVYAVGLRKQRTAPPEPAAEAGAVKIDAGPLR